jgi:SNW domain-containing protein 1
MDLNRKLPKPKYTGEEEELPQHTKSRGPRVVAASSLDNQVVLQRKGPPPYGQRLNWRPRNQDDYADGGAFPECLVAQYPLDMGRKSTSSSNALAIQVDGEGKVNYDAIARRGHSASRIVQSSFKDLIPLRQRADVGEISLERRKLSHHPHFSFENANQTCEADEETVRATTEKTKAALSLIVAGTQAAQKPKNVKGITRAPATFVRYQPSQNQMQVNSCSSYTFMQSLDLLTRSRGDYGKKQERIIKIVGRQQDPMEPPKFKHKKIPRGPPTPPPPVLHSPPRKLTAADQEAWRIPPPISNWKNPKGYTIPLDKRLAADGRGLEDKTISDKFSSFSESLYTADRVAREEVKQRALMQQRLAEKEKAQREEHLRQLALKAREERASAAEGRRHRSPRGSGSRSRSRSESFSDSEHSDASSQSEGERERERIRRERRKEDERELRQSRMGTERRIQMMAREQGRDISEKIALGLAKPTASGESMYDSRLFNQSSGFASGFNEDQAYDKPLFAAHDAISSIYRPKAREDDGEDAGETYDRISKSNRFEGFGGTGESEKRDGPVQFEKDTGTMPSAAPAAATGDDDPFNIGQMISDVTGGKAGQKKHGLQEADDRKAKRARVHDED